MVTKLASGSADSWQFAMESGLPGHQWPPQKKLRCLKKGGSEYNKLSWLQLLSQVARVAKVY